MRQTAARGCGASSCCATLERKPQALYRGAPRGACSPVSRRGARAVALSAADFAFNPFDASLADGVASDAFPPAGLSVAVSTPPFSCGGASSCSASAATVSELEVLLSLLPSELRSPLESHPSLHSSLLELVLDLGRVPLARFPEGDAPLSSSPLSRLQLDAALAACGAFGADNRAGMDRTLHRVSALRNRLGTVVGLTARVGRSIAGSAALIRDLALRGESILLLGRPGVGKTTAIRELARILADEARKRVVIVDTSNEIGGDGDVPHPAVGGARRMQVRSPEAQHMVLIEAVENHMPQVIVVDEIGTEAEVSAARTIAQRGVQLVATAHGHELANVLKNPALVGLVGGVESVTLGDDEARRRGGNKSVLERQGPPTFTVAVEMLAIGHWRVHTDVGAAVDALLAGVEPPTEMRRCGPNGEVLVEVTRPAGVGAGVPPAGAAWPTRGSSRASSTSSSSSSSSASSSFSTGQRLVWPPSGTTPSQRAGRGGAAAAPQQQQPAFAHTFVPQPSSWFSPTPSLPPPSPPQYAPPRAEPSVVEAKEVDAAPAPPLPQARPPVEAAPPLRLFSHGIDGDALARTVAALSLGARVVLTPSLEEADAVLALRARLGRAGGDDWLRLTARQRGLPLYAIKTDTLSQLVRALKTILGLAVGEGATDGERAEAATLSATSAVEADALEEVRLAVERMVIPRGTAVELLPRPPHIRVAQEALVATYRLTSVVAGAGAGARLRVLPFGGEAAVL